VVGRVGLGRGRNHGLLGPLAAESEDMQEVNAGARVGNECFRLAVARDVMEQYSIVHRVTVVQLAQHPGSELSLGELIQQQGPLPAANDWCQDLVTITSERNAFHVPDIVGLNARDPGDLQFVPSPILTELVPINRFGIEAADHQVQVSAVAGEITKVHM
jgi:hypothetical protein